MQAQLLTQNCSQTDYHVNLMMTTPLMADIHGNTQIQLQSCIAKRLHFISRTLGYCSLSWLTIIRRFHCICYGSQSGHCIYVQLHFLIQIFNHARHYTIVSIPPVISCSQLASFPGSCAPRPHTRAWERGQFKICLIHIQYVFRI